MIEKLNRVFEKLPPEHRDIMREAFIILIEEVINAIVKEIREGFKKQGEENERMLQNIERIWQAIDRLTKPIEETRKTIKEGFERQEKENERIWQNIERIWQAMNERFERQAQENEKIWQAIKEGFERQEKENQRIWQAIEELRKDMKEGFERQEKENKKIWQNIERIWQSIEKLENTMKEGLEKQAQENEKIWQAIKEGFERQEKENQRIWQAIEEMRKSSEEQFKRIWQAIEKTNERLDKLILAFEKAEKRNDQTRKQVGVLTDNFGYLLEDRAIRTLPKLLKERYGFEITEPLRRDFIEINGKYIEVNIYGKARKNNEEFIIIGEAKTRITNKAIIGFLEKCNNFEGKQFRVMIGYLITPKIKQILENNNIIFINSYELEL
jgi:DNA repair exonuclease SbcCD ATPase subunit